MSQNRHGAPAWLFSFVDLAFLMLIAMTQMAADSTAEAPDLGEMLVPRIGAESTEAMSSGAARAWQVRVHPRDMEVGVFEVTLVGGDVAQSDVYADADGLRARLEALSAEGAERPLLAPHEDSRSQDMLDAAAEIEARWPGRRRATVSRDLGSLAGA